MHYQNGRQRGRRNLHEGVTLRQYIFKGHPLLNDKLESIVADLESEGFKANRSDVMRALIMTQLDNALDIAREHLGGESEFS